MFAASSATLTTRRLPGNLPLGAGGRRCAPAPPVSECIRPTIVFAGAVADNHHSLLTMKVKKE